MPRPLTPQPRTLSKQRGVGMLEVLVSVVILSIGLLGMAGLQARALKGNQSSLQRSQAVMQSYSILDSIRANRSNAEGYKLAKTCASGGIGSGSLIESTQKAWLKSLEDNIGAKAAGTTCGTISCVASGGSGSSVLCTITIEWDDSRAGGSANETLQTRSII